MEPESSRGSSVKRREIMDTGGKFHNEVGQMLELVGNIHPWQWSKLPWMRPGAAKLQS